jgi:cytochrome b561
MRIKNDSTHFGLVAILLHWLMALLIISLLCMGLYMVGLPISLEKLKFYGWHKEFGLLVLGLAIIRFVWRLSNKTPELDLPRLEHIAARLAHLALYGFMFGMPLSGWLMTSAAGLPPSFFGLFTLPSLVAANEEWRQLFAFAHEWLGYGLIATICVHAAAALKHHFINKDDILRRMFP